MLLGFEKLPENIKNTTDLVEFAKGSRTIKNKVLSKQKKKKN